MNNSAHFQRTPLKGEGFKCPLHCLWMSWNGSYAMEHWIQVLKHVFMKNFLFKGQTHVLFPGRKYILFKNDMLKNWNIFFQVEKFYESIKVPYFRVSPILSWISSHRLPSQIANGVWRIFFLNLYNWYSHSI